MATISGGLAIPPSAWVSVPANMSGDGSLAHWIVDLAKLNPMLAPNSSHLAALRHLYVNGSRAARTIAFGTSRGATKKRYPGRPSGTAWGDKDWAPQSHSNTNFSCDGGATTNCSFAYCGAGRPVRVSSKGLTLINPTAVRAALQWPAGGRGVEFVFSGVDPAPWAESRCSVVEVVPAADNLTAEVVLEPQCFTAYAYKCIDMGGHAIYPPTGIENVAGTSNLAAGTFYIDKANAKLSYAPRKTAAASASASSFLSLFSPLVPTEMANVVLPVAEQLVVGAGVRGSPVVDVRFSNLAFTHTTWGRVARGPGYVEVQSGKILDGFGWPGKDSAGMVSAPGAGIAFHNCSGIGIDRCSFSRLGSAAVELSERAQNSTVSNSWFYDLSGGAVTVAVWDNGMGATGRYFVAPTSKSELDFDEHLRIVNNTIAWVGVEYRGSAAISAGYVRHATIAHNSIAHVPNTGISLGWGWGRGPNQTQLQTLMRANVVTGNAVADYKRVLNDGGCVYTQSNQPGTLQ
jgi:hypothetical protein